MRRRDFIIAATVFGGLGAAGYVTSRPPEAAQQMTPPEILSALRQSQAILIDVRRPDEWAATGVADGAIALDMRESDFIESIMSARAANPGLPVALICARGVRSRRVTAQLADVGITDVIDVPEGMLGSAAGPGWIARGLPVNIGKPSS